MGNSNILLSNLQFFCFVSFHVCLSSQSPVPPELEKMLDKIRQKFLKEINERLANQCDEINENVDVIKRKFAKILPICFYHRNYNEGKGIPIDLYVSLYNVDRRIIALHSFLMCQCKLDCETVKTTIHKIIEDLDSIQKRFDEIEPDKECPLCFSPKMPAVFKQYSSVGVQSSSSSSTTVTKRILTLMNVEWFSFLFFIFILIIYLIKEFINDNI